MGDARIRGQVAKVLNARELVINRGEKDGVTVGMKFSVLDPKAENISDPETGEVLGSIDRPKVNVEIATTSDRLSIARTYKTKTINVGGRGVLAANLGSALTPPKWVTQRETLKTDETTWEDLDEAESYVRRGDPVTQVFEMELDEETAGR
jgi:hypothetical protein